MRAEQEYIAGPETATASAVRLERAGLESASLVAEQNVVDFFESEARDLDRRVDENQLLELDLQRVEIPLPFLAQAIDREPQHPEFVAAEMADANAGDTFEAELLGSGVADLAVDRVRSRRRSAADRKSPAWRSTAATSRT